MRRREFIKVDLNAAALDICGFKQAPSYQRDVVWGRSELMESFRQAQHTAWHGRALAILRAEADGLSSAEVTVRVK